MKIYNTLTKKKEELFPIEPGKVRMYVCGPTVYNLIHIGNARPMIVFDTVRRYMEHKGYEVNYVSNFTDVDDKIIKKSVEEGVSAEVISERYIERVQKRHGIHECAPCDRSSAGDKRDCGHGGDDRNADRERDTLIRRRTARSISVREALRNMESFPQKSG